jgi:MFS family permease
LTGRRAQGSGGLPAGFWRFATVAGLMRGGMFVAYFLAYYLARSLRLDAVQVAAVVAAWGAGWGAGDPLAGWLADRGGPRPVIVSGGALVAAAYLTAPVAHGFGEIIAVAAAIGLSHDAWRPATTGAVAAAAVSEEQSERALSALAWIMQAASIAAAVAGGLIGATAGLVWLFPANAVAAALAAIVAATIPDAGARMRRDRRAVTGNAASLVLLGIFTVLTLLPLAAEQEESIALPLKYASLGIGPLSAGLIMAVNPASCAVIQPLTQKWLKRRYAVVMCAIGMALLGAGMAVTGSGRGVAWFAATSLIWVTGEVLLLVGGQLVVSGLAPPGGESGYLGFWQGSFGSSVLIAAVGGAVLIHLGGLHLLWVSCAIAGLGSAGLCSCLAAPIAIRSRAAVRDRRPREPLALQEASQLRGRGREDTMRKI